MVCGIESIDMQHQTLVELINQVHDIVSSGEIHDRLKRSFDELIDYTLVHFHHEEGVFAAGGYPLLTAHKARHQALAQQVIKHLADLNHCQDMMVAAELLFFLKEWLTNHIQEEDRKVCQYILEHARDTAA